MKDLFFSIILLLAVFISATRANAQNDTVCAGSTVNYKTNSLAASYKWVIPPSATVVDTSAIGDSISINWADSAGIDTLKVVGMNATGCPSDTTILAVVRLKPTALLTIDNTTDSVCVNSYANFNLSFTGVGPWHATWNYSESYPGNYNSNGVGLDLPGVAPGGSVNANPYTFNSNQYPLPGTGNYSLAKVTDSHGCVGTVSGFADVKIFGKPATSPITKY